jgi:hypothetical protein
MKNRLLHRWHIAFFMALILVVSPTLLIAQATDAVTASDQESDGASVVVAGVTAAAPGWIVIHIDSGGSPGPVLGQSAVAAGDNTDVVVALDPPLEGDTTLWAMLHVDEGVVGEYEFPGADVPVRDGDMVVMTPFVATVGTAEVAVEPTAAPTEEAAPPEVLPVTGAGLSGLAQVAPALLATLGALAAGLWVSRRR